MSAQRDNGVGCLAPILSVALLCIFAFGLVLNYDLGPQPKSAGVAPTSVEAGAQAPGPSGPHVRKLAEQPAGNTGWELYCIRGQAVLWTTSGVYPLTEAEPCSYR